MFDQVLVGAGLPAPVCEYRFDLVRQWRFDFAWPDLHLAAEIEGGTHSGGRHVRGRGYEEDCRKYNAAGLQGWSVLRFTSRMVKSGEALAVIEQAIRQRRGA